MGAVVADTHALIWYLFEPKRLSSIARTVLLQAEANPGIIYVPSISVVETWYLVEKGTLTESIFNELVDSLLDNDTAHRHPFEPRHCSGAKGSIQASDSRHAGSNHCRDSAPFEAPARNTRS